MTEEHRINIMEDTPAVISTDDKSSPQTTLQYASITERFVALLIDYGIIFFPLQFVAWLICKTVGQYLEVWQLIAMIVGMNLVFVLYDTIFSSGGRVTLGKNLVGIAGVNKEKTGPISMPRAFLRALGYYVSAILFWADLFLRLWMTASVHCMISSEEAWWCSCVSAIGGKYGLCVA